MMTPAGKLAKALAQAEDSVEYWLDIAVTDFTRDLHARMEELGISQGELARRMGTSRPYVTKLLDGSNFTLQTMVKLAMALDAVVRLRLEGREERTSGPECGRQMENGNAGSLRINFVLPEQEQPVKAFPGKRALLRKKR